MKIPSSCKTRTVVFCALWIISQLFLHVGAEVFDSTDLLLCEPLPDYCTMNTTLTILDNQQHHQAGENSNNLSSRSTSSRDEALAALQASQTSTIKCVDIRNSTFSSGERHESSSSSLPFLQGNETAGFLSLNLTNLLWVQICHSNFVAGYELWLSGVTTMSPPNSLDDCTSTSDPSSQSNTSIRRSSSQVLLRGNTFTNSPLVFNNTFIQGGVAFPSSSGGDRTCIVEGAQLIVEHNTFVLGRALQFVSAPIGGGGTEPQLKGGPLPLLQHSLAEAGAGGLGASILFSPLGVISGNSSTFGSNGHISISRNSFHLLAQEWENESRVFVTLTHFFGLACKSPSQADCYLAGVSNNIPRGTANQGYTSSSTSDKKSSSFAPPFYLEGNIFQSMCHLHAPGAGVASIANVDFGCGVWTVPVGSGYNLPLSYFRNNTVNTVVQDAPSAFNTKAYFMHFGLNHYIVNTFSGWSCQSVVCELRPSFTYFRPSQEFIFAANTVNITTSSGSDFASLPASCGTASYLFHFMYSPLELLSSSGGGTKFSISKNNSIFLAGCSEAWVMYHAGIPQGSMIKFRQGATSKYGFMNNTAAVSLQGNHSLYEIGNSSFIIDCKNGAGGIFTVRQVLYLSVRTTSDYKTGRGLLTLNGFQSTLALHDNLYDITHAGVEYGLLGQSIPAPGSIFATEGGSILVERNSSIYIYGSIARIQSPLAATIASQFQLTAAYSIKSFVQLHGISPMDLVGSVFVISDAELSLQGYNAAVFLWSGPFNFTAAEEDLVIDRDKLQVIHYYSAGYNSLLEVSPTHVDLLASRNAYGFRISWGIAEPVTGGGTWNFGSKSGYGPTHHSTAAAEAGVGYSGGTCCCGNWTFKQYNPPTQQQHGKGLSPSPSYFGEFKLFSLYHATIVIDHQPYSINVFSGTAGGATSCDGGHDDEHGSVPLLQCRRSISVDAPAASVTGFELSSETIPRYRNEFQNFLGVLNIFNGALDVAQSFNGKYSIITHEGSDSTDGKPLSSYSAPSHFLPPVGSSSSSSASDKRSSTLIFSTNTSFFKLLTLGGYYTLVEASDVSINALIGYDVKVTIATPSLSSAQNSDVYLFSIGATMNFGASISGLGLRRGIFIGDSSVTLRYFSSDETAGSQRPLLSLFSLAPTGQLTFSASASGIVMSGLNLDGVTLFSAQPASSIALESENSLLFSNNTIVLPSSWTSTGSDGDASSSVLSSAAITFPKTTVGSKSQILFWSNNLTVLTTGLSVGEAAPTTSSSFSLLSVASSLEIDGSSALSIMQNAVTLALNGQGTDRSAGNVSASLLSLPNVGQSSISSPSASSIFIVGNALAVLVTTTTVSTNTSSNSTISTSTSLGLVYLADGSAFSPENTASINKVARCNFYLVEEESCGSSANNTHDRRGSSGIYSNPSQWTGGVIQEFTSSTSYSTSYTSSNSQLCATSTVQPVLTPSGTSSHLSLPFEFMKCEASCSSAAMKQSYCNPAVDVDPMETARPIQWLKNQDLYPVATTRFLSPTSSFLEEKNITINSTNSEYMCVCPHVLNACTNSPFCGFDAGAYIPGQSQPWSSSTLAPPTTAAPSTTTTVIPTTTTTTATTTDTVTTSLPASTTLSSTTSTSTPSTPATTTSTTTVPTTTPLPAESSSFTFSSSLSSESGSSSLEEEESGENKNNNKKKTTASPRGSPPSRGSPTPTKTIVAGSVAGGGIVVVGFPLLCCFIYRRKKNAAQLPFDAFSEDNDYLSSGLLRGEDSSGKETEEEAQLRSLRGSQAIIMSDGLNEDGAGDDVKHDLSQKHSAHGLSLDITAEAVSETRKLQRKKNEKDIGRVREEEHPATPMSASSNSLTEWKKKPTALNFRRGRMIGAGSFGRVFVGLDDATGKLLAAKEISLIGDSNPMKKMQALKEEVDLMKKLRHQHVVEYLGTDSPTSTEFLIFMEFLPGGSLHNAITEFGSMSQRLAAKYTAQALSGLQYLHDQGIVHRDIKAANMLLDKDGVLKLADMGCAQDADEVQSMRGTLLWMAPEVLQASGGGGGGGSSASSTLVNVAKKSDIWSLGCTVIEMVSGDYPFAWSGKNFKTMRAIAEGGEKLDEIWNTAPDSLTSKTLAFAFIRRCCQFDPDLRPEAEELLRTDPFILKEFADEESREELMRSRSQTQTSASNRDSSSGGDGGSSRSPRDSATNPLGGNSAVNTMDSAFGDIPILNSVGSRSSGCESVVGESGKRRVVEQKKSSASGSGAPTPFPNAGGSSHPSSSLSSTTGGAAGRTGGFIAGLNSFHPSLLSSLSSSGIGGSENNSHNQSYSNSGNLMLSLERRNSSHPQQEGGGAALGSVTEGRDLNLFLHSVATDISLSTNNQPAVSIRFDDEESQQDNEK